MRTIYDGCDTAILSAAIYHPTPKEVLGEGCEIPHFSKGMCQVHAARVRKTGTPFLSGLNALDEGTTTLEERFWNERSSATAAGSGMGGLMSKVTGGSSSRVATGWLTGFPLSFIEGKSRMVRTLITSAGIAPA